MNPRKLNVGFAFFPYGGNGGTSSEVPDIRNWFARALKATYDDDRIGQVVTQDFSDTPITMTRNRAVVWARNNDVDVLVMCDSDQKPDSRLGVDLDAKPFFESSFDYLYEHYDRGPCVVCAPYCGPPPVSPVYVFYWKTTCTDMIERGDMLEMYSREQARMMGGIQDCAAQPTGLIMFDVRAFELTDPAKCARKDSTGRPVQEDYKGWFYYEWEDVYAAYKGSTEDVTATRDISLAGMIELGYNPIKCNWDAWAGHWKPLLVDKPLMVTADQVAQKLKSAALRSNNRGEKLVMVGNGKPKTNGTPEHTKRMLQELIDKGRIRPSDISWEDKRKGILEESTAKKLSEQTKPRFEKKHWRAWRPSVEYAEKLADNFVIVLDVGPGRHPVTFATKFVGRKELDNYEGKFYECDLEYGIGLAGGNQTFVYCRHTVEDLLNPQRLLRDIAPCDGFIETPSPMAECCHGVDYYDNGCRGYTHHHWIVWTDSDGVLNLLPKLPSLDNILTLDEKRCTELLRSSPVFWNSYHEWSGDLRYKIWRTELDFDVATDYERLVRQALREGERSCRRWKLKFGGLVDRTESVSPTDAPEQLDDTLPVRIGDMFTPKEDLAALENLVRSEKPDFIVEVGSWVGESARALRRGAPNSKIYCVDTFEGSEGDPATERLIEEYGKDAIRDAFKANTKDLNIELWQEKSLHAAEGVKEDIDELMETEIDFVFIDGAHDYESVTNDILAWGDLMKDGGLMAVHDYGVPFLPDVKAAVEQIVHDGRLGFIPWFMVGEYGLCQGSTVFWMRLYKKVKRDEKAEADETKGHAEGSEDAETEVREVPV